MIRLGWWGPCVDNIKPWHEGKKATTSWKLNRGDLSLWWRKCHQYFFIGVVRTTNQSGNFASTRISGADLPPSLTGLLSSFQTFKNLFKIIGFYKINPLNFCFYPIKKAQILVPPHTRCLYSSLSLSWHSMTNK